MSRRRGWRWSTRAERLEIRRRVATGERLDDVALGVGRSKRTVQLIVSPFGGIQPRPTVRSTLRLSNAEREEISRGLRGGESLRRIAARLARPPSTVSREVARNGGRRRYRAHLAEDRAFRSARRPRCAKLARNRPLRRTVERLLELRWSPQQIAW
jgi:IS30 family transposase